jgi:hypothetical protein
MADQGGAPAAGSLRSGEDERRANVRVSRSDKEAMAAFVVGAVATYQHMSLWLWVGGTIGLSRDKLTFRPNALNLAFEEGDANPLDTARPFSIEIPLAAVTGVEMTSRPFTRIHVRTARGTLSVRCSGAPDFAEAIGSRAALAGV